MIIIITKTTTKIKSKAMKKNPNFILNFLYFGCFSNVDILCFVCAYIFVVVDTKKTKTK